MGGQVQVPADVLAGLPQMGLDVGGGSKVSKDQTASSEFSDAGECIWALQYRQIKLKWYSSKKMENAALETKTRWLTFDGAMRRPKELRRSNFNLPSPEPVDFELEDFEIADFLSAEPEYIEDGLPNIGFGLADLEGQYEVQNTVGETLFEDTEDMIEAFIDDELDLDDQFEVQNTSGEALFIPRQAERRESSVSRGSNMAVEDLGEDVQLSRKVSIIERA